MSEIIPSPQIYETNMIKESDLNEKHFLQNRTSEIETTKGTEKIQMQTYESKTSELGDSNYVASCKPKKQSYKDTTKGIGSAEESWIVYSESQYETDDEVESATEDDIEETNLDSDNETKAADDFKESILSHHKKQALQKEDVVLESSNALMGDGNNLRETNKLDEISSFEECQTTSQSKQTSSFKNNYSKKILIEGEANILKDKEKGTNETLLGSLNIEHSLDDFISGNEEIISLKVDDIDLEMKQFQDKDKYNVHKDNKDTKAQTYKNYDSSNSSVEESKNHQIIDFSNATNQIETTEVTTSYEQRQVTSSKTDLFHESEHITDIAIDNVVDIEGIILGTDERNETHNLKQCVSDHESIVVSQTKSIPSDTKKPSSNYNITPKDQIYSKEINLSYKEEQSILSQKV